MGPGSLGSLELCPSLQVSYLLLNHGSSVTGSCCPPLMGSSKTLFCCAWCSNDVVFFGLNFLHVAQNSWLAPRLHMTCSCHRKTFTWTLLFGGCWMPDSIMGTKIPSPQLVIKGFGFMMKSVGEIV